MQNIKIRLRRFIQTLLIWTLRPYIYEERFGWGRIYGVTLDYKRDWLWKGAPEKTVRGKLHGYLMNVDLSTWPGRSTFFLGRWYDTETQLLLAEMLRPGDTVVDIGANDGMFALSAARLVGNTGRVICFEPNPNCVKRLERTTKINSLDNINVMPVGLGERDETLTLKVPVADSGEATFGTTSHVDIYETRVQVGRGDEFLKNENPAFIKIDVEGFETNVIRGLLTTIERHKPAILTEFIDSLLRACGSSRSELSALMHSLGYAGFTIDVRKSKRQFFLTLKRIADDTDALDTLWIHNSDAEHLSVVNKLLQSTSNV